MHGKFTTLKKRGHSYAKMEIPGTKRISLLFWAWLWGVWGMLLGIPIIVIVKVVSQHVEQLHSVAELLGEGCGLVDLVQSGSAKPQDCAGDVK